MSKLRQLLLFFSDLTFIKWPTAIDFFADVYKFDEEYQANEDKYKALSRELLGSDADSSGGDEDGDSSSGSGDSSDDDDDDEDGEGKDKAASGAGGGVIIDNTETNLVALRRTIYLTIHSSLDYEECAHKLMKMQLKPGQEIELCHMFLDCCAEQRTYEKFYGLLAQRFCNINKMYVGPFEEIFKDTYATTHRLDTNRLRNVGKFFAHLMFTDAIGWDVLSCIRMNEEDTTSSSRIFVKILFQELVEYMGLGKLNGKLKTNELQEFFDGLFPKDNPKNTRFAINFFTSIGLGGLTDTLREHLKSAPKPVQPLILEIAPASSESGSSSSDSSDDSDSDSSSSDEKEKKRKKKKELKKKKKSSDRSDKSSKAKRKSSSKKKEEDDKEKGDRKRKHKKRRKESSSSSDSDSADSSTEEKRQKRRTPPPPSRRTASSEEDEGQRSKRSKHSSRQEKRPRRSEERQSRRSEERQRPRRSEERQRPRRSEERQSRRSEERRQPRGSEEREEQQPQRRRESRSNSRDWKL